jgi:uncharacterized oxidoreductase
MDVVIDAGCLESLLGEIFDHAGCERDEAERIGYRLVRANLTGHDSHGVIRTSRYVDWLDRGMFKAGQTINVVFENDAIAIVDGVYGFGQTVAEEAVRLGIDKAKKQGAAIIALKNAGHIGRVGDWAELAAEAGLVSIHFVNARGSVLVAPFGSSERRISTAPFCAGVPQKDGDPFILDFATSVVAEGKVLVAAKGGKPLPDGALIDGAGELTTDPAALYGEAGPDAPPQFRNGEGAIRAMGLHKGSGLALLCELLGGSLTGNNATGIEGDQFANGMLSIYLSPEVFDQGGGFADDVKRYIDYIKSARRSDPDTEILTPGDPERRTKAERLANGIPLSVDTWASIVETARKVGLEDGDIARLSGRNEV